MKKSIVIAFLFVVTVPLLLVAWLGWRSLSSEQDRMEQQVRELQRERLKEFADNQDRWIESIQTSLLSYLSQLQPKPFSEWPELQRQNRFANQLFAADAGGALLWPNESVLALTKEEFDFIRLYESGNIDLTPKTGENPSTRLPYFWTSWFEGPGQQWAFCIRNGDGSVFGTVLDRSSFMAEAIAQLPDNTADSKDRTFEESFAVMNELGEVLYSWGGDLEKAGESDFLETVLPVPLNTWKIRLASSITTSAAGFQQIKILTLGASLLGLVVVTLLAAYYLYRETRREFEEARQRVNFVNQVSHEFKTPLTNIQLYSELLEEEVGAETPNKHLAVIREEAGKLNRMIANVLTFARSQKTTQKLHPRKRIPDELIEEQLRIHRPGLQRRNITLQSELNAGNAMSLDPEVVGQVLGNLLSNAEKYAPGATVSVMSRQENDLLTVTVRDTGPGIPGSKRESIFQPFTRLEDSTTEGVSGTGIGLSIARDLARLHGGDLRLEPSDKGAAFTFSLNAIA